MATTILTEHQPQREGEMKPGGRIQEGNSAFAQTNHDLALMSQRIDRAILANVDAAFAQGAYLLGYEETGTTGTWSVRFRPRLNHWDTSTTRQFKLHVFAQNVDGRLRFGATTLASTTGGTSAGWVTSSAFSLVSGVQSYTVEFAPNGGGATEKWWFWVIEEIASSSSSDLDSFYVGPISRRLDDTVFDADFNLSVFQLGVLENNLRRACVASAPSAAQCYPVDVPVRLSSSSDRAHGPYAIKVPPWCDQVEVNILVQKDADSTKQANLDIYAFCEGEDRATALARGTSITTTSLTAASWTLPVTARNPDGWGTQRVYIGFRSEIGSVQDTGFNLTQWSFAQFDTNKSIAGGPYTQGRVFQVDGHDESISGGIKGGGAVGANRRSFVDLAVVESNSTSPVWLSPNVYKQPLEAITSSLNNTDLYGMGSLDLFSVQLRCLATGLTSEVQRADPTLAPSGLHARGMRERLNELTRFGTSTIGMAQWGGERSITLTGELVLGIWQPLFPDVSSWSQVAAFPLPSMPQPSSPSSEAVYTRKFKARVYYVCLNQGGYASLSQGEVDWRLVLTSDATSNPTSGIIGTAGDTVTDYPPIYRPRDVQESWTLYDVLAAHANKYSYDGTDAYVYSYAQQYAWVDEALEGLPVLPSKEMEVDVNTTSSNYPCWLEIQGDLNSSSEYEICVLGVVAWYDERA